MPTDMIAGLIRNLKLAASIVTNPGVVPVDNCVRVYVIALFAQANESLNNLTYPNVV